MRRVAFLMLLGLAVPCLVSDASAQSQSLFGNNSPISQSGRSQSGSGRSSTSAASSALSSASQAAGGQQSGLGQSGIGGDGSAFAGPQLNEVGSLSQQAIGNTTGFVGANTQGTFVGNRMAGQGGLGGNGPTFSALGGSDFNPDSFNQSGSGGGQSSTRQVRPRYRLGFDFARAPAAEISTRIDVQLSRLTESNPQFAGVQIVINDQGIAELRGAAPTEDASRLIENIVRLEPGVRDVDNQLVVPPSAQPY
jgi:hypothetical protein